MVGRGLSREKLVAIAHDYVAENGLDDLTVRRLARAAEVTPGALYKHFSDQRDLRRAMADAIFEAVDLSDVDTAVPDAAQVLACCTALRAAMLRFRDGGRIVAGSYAPFAAAAALGATMRELLHAIIRPAFDAGDIAYVLRNYTVGYVIEEQAYLGLVASGEWQDLITETRAGSRGGSSGASDAIAILGDDRDRRFCVGVEAILTGVVA